MQISFKSSRTSSQEFHPDLLQLTNSCKMEILYVAGQREKKYIQKEKHQYSSHVQDKQHQKLDPYYMPDLVSVNFENFK